MSIPQTPSPLSNIIAAKTYNAAWFSGSTKEAQITAAIAAAVLDGALYVYVPANMLPYTASSVTFNANVKMLREGGDSIAFDVKAYGAAGGGVIDDSAAFTAWLTAVTGKTGIIPPDTYLSSVSIIPTAGTVIFAYGVTYLYSGTGTAVQQGIDHFTLLGLKGQKSGAAGTSIGLQVGTGVATGHYTVIRDCEFTLFDQGVVQQLAFYGSFYNVNCHANVTNNWHLTNTSISNDLFDCLGRGEGITLIGALIDDSTANSADIRFHGGTFEGNVVQQMDIRGADLVNVFGGHYETNAPTALTGVVTLTNASTAVSGVGTLFTTQVKVGQYIRLNADSAQFAARIQTITDDLNLVLSATYRGTGGAGAATGSAGLFRITSGSGASSKCAFWNPELGTASGAPPAFYIQNATDTRIEGTDINMPVILGTGAAKTRVNCTSLSGGIDDQDPTSSITIGGNSSFSAGITGGTTTPTATFKYVRDGDDVTLWVNSLLVTSNSVSCTITGLPLIITPKNNSQIVPCAIYDNGVPAWYAAKIATDGTITLSKAVTGAGGDFTNVGTKGTSTCTLKYKII